MRVLVNLIIYSRSWQKSKFWVIMYTIVLRKLRLCSRDITSPSGSEEAGRNARGRGFGVAIVAFEVSACAFSGGCDAVIIDNLMHVFLK